MTREEASQAWRAIFPELEDRLLAIRPKLKSYDAQLVLVIARRMVIAKLDEITTVEQLRAIALEPFARFKYLKRSPFAAEAASTPTA